MRCPRSAGSIILVAVGVIGLGGALGCSGRRSSPAPAAQAPVSTSGGALTGGAGRAPARRSRRMPGEVLVKLRSPAAADVVARAPRTAGVLSAPGLPSLGQIFSRHKVGRAVPTYPGTLPRRLAGVMTVTHELP